MKKNEIKLELKIGNKMENLLRMQIDGGKKRSLRRMSMNPTQSYQFVLFLKIEQLNFVFGITRVRGSVLFWNQNVGHHEFILSLKTNFF